MQKHVIFFKPLGEDTWSDGGARALNHLFACKSQGTGSVVYSEDVRDIEAAFGPNMLQGCRIGDRSKKEDMAAEAALSSMSVMAETAQGEEVPFPMQDGRSAISSSEFSVGPRTREARVKPY